MAITKQELIGDPNDKTKEMYKDFGVMLEDVIQKGLDIRVSLNENKVTGWEKKQQQIIISILKEVLEKIDGIIILSEKYSQQNIFVLARSVLEGFLDLNFMLKNPKRALAYIYCKSLDYISKYEKMELSLEDQKGIKLIQQELGEELKNQKRKQFQNKKWMKEHMLNWKSFYFKRKNDDPYKNSGSKLHYSFLCAETHNQMSLVNNYPKDNEFYIREFRSNDKIGIGLISMMIVVFSGEIFERIVKLYIQKSLSDLEVLEKWREKMIKKSEEIIKLDNERLFGTTKLNVEI
ncbi:MAG: DUF5677 domain-containing protein [Psychrilyobacter sp.]|uniref:DUF5677 domain-containing protein n=1 Tax=Psychrilyobacter sp. TaxID=2586924 RepID=UPI003C785CFE